MSRMRPRSAERRDRRHLQSVVLIIGLAFLAWFLLRQFQMLMRASERVEVETVVGQLQRALTADVAARRVQNRMQTLGALAGANPFDLYGPVNQRYAGPVSDRHDKPDPGNWYFDSRLRDLVYRVREPEAFATSGPFADEVRLHVELVFDDRNGNGRFDAGDQASSAVIAASYPYSWKSAPR
jgi:hypothetical protein